VLNLLIARATARRRELAIRVAVGASRTRLIQQLAVEALVLAAAGGAAGVVLASWITSGVAAFRFPGSLPVRLDFHLDARVLAYAFALTCLTVATVGVLAAFRASRVNVDAAAGGDIARMVLADSALLGAAGAIVGAAAAFGVGRAISRLLFGVVPTDPISCLAAAACLVIVILVAAAAPAARAVAIDPIASLRE